MPSNTDPAFSGIDPADILAIFRVGAPAIVEKVVEATAQPLKSAPFYEARTMVVPVGQPVLMLPYHAGRIRFAAKALNPAAVVMIGNLGQLQSDSGYTLGTAADVDFRTVDQVYVKTVTGVDGAAAVTLWAEYAVE